ncbi:MAG: sensor protein [Acidobacteriaceae bacterium]|nr:sensor protein [Acidobacteriaceae bacterium]
MLAQDVTEKRKSELRLRHSEEKFSKAFRSSPLAISITTQAEGQYVDVNDAFLKMMEYERAEVIGRTSAELNLFADPGSRNAVMRLLGQLVRDAL